MIRVGVGYKKKATIVDYDKLGSPIRREVDVYRTVFACINGIVFLGREGDDLECITVDKFLKQYKLA